MIKKIKINSEDKLNNSLKLLVKSSILVLIGLLFSKIFTYFYRIIVARYFGIEVYGLFSLALMILGWFVAFSTLGLSEGILRYIAVYRGKRELEKIKHIFHFSLIILFFSTIFSGIILFLASEFISLKLFHNSNLIIFLKIFSVLIPLSVFSNIFLYIIKAYEQIGWYSFILNIFQNAVKLFALGLFIFLGFKSNSIIYSYFVAIVLTLLFTYLFCKYKISEIFGKSKLIKKDKDKISKELLFYSFPVLFYEIMSNLFYWIDSFFLGFFKGVSEVGIYNVAVPIAALLTFTSYLFMQLFYPLINKEYSKKNFGLINELSKQTGKWIFIINLPLFILMTLFPGVIINLLFGKEYLIAENSLRILGIGVFISSMFHVFPHLLLMKGKSKLFLMDIIIVSIINILLCFILIPKENILFMNNSSGIIGAAIATTISTIFLNLLFLFQVKHYLSIIPIRRKILRILIVSVIPIGILLYLKQFIQINILSLVLLGSFFIILYLFLIFITGCLDKNDFMILKTFKKKITAYNIKNFKK